MPLSSTTDVHGRVGQPLIVAYIDGLGMGGSEETPPARLADFEGCITKTEVRDDRLEGCLSSCINANLFGHS